MSTKDVLVIGDIHGRDIWKKIVDENSFDKVIFIGDYFDSFNIEPEEQVYNFEQIIKYKESNLDDVILLIGNHDYHYMDGIDSRYSGYQRFYYYKINDIVEKAYNDGLLQVSYKYGKCLFTHAGVTKTWCINNNINPYHQKIDEEINMLFEYQRYKFDINSFGGGYGDEIYQSPIWVRPNSLQKDCIDYKHIIGHTHNEKIIYTDKYINVDCLPYDYLKIKL